MAVVVFSAPVLAQFHGAAVLMNCESPAKVGDEVNCVSQYRNIDDFADTHEISEFWHVLDPFGINMRLPDSGNLPIDAVSAGVVCAPGPTFPCDVPSDGNPATFEFVNVMCTVVIPEGLADPVSIQANVTEQDLCDDPDTEGCSEVPNMLQQPASVSIFIPGLEVTKTGPPIAKVGDEIIYEVLVEDTSIGDSFPGFENCELVDSLAGGPFAIEPGVPFFYPYVVQEMDSNPLVNLATVNCDVVGFDNGESDEAEWSVDLFEPSIAVDKTGDPVSKVGDGVDYTFTLSNTSSPDTPPLDCVAVDDLLGEIFNGVLPPGDTVIGLSRVVQPDDPDPLENTVTLTCSPEGHDNVLGASDSHITELFQPAIAVDKTGDLVSKVGDEVDYTFTLLNISSLDTPPLDCVAVDDLLGEIFNGVLPPGDTVINLSRTVQEGDPDPLENTVTLTCSPEGFDNVDEASASHEVDLRDPSVTLSKVCRPDPVLVGNPIEWEVTICNTGDTDVVCEINDPTAGLMGEIVPVLPGDCEALTASRTVEEGDAPVISNEATAVCDVDGFDNVLEPDPAMAECEVDIPAELCRTPGFWKNRAGNEKGGRNITGEVIASATPPGLPVCGQFIDEEVDALEAMCVSIEGYPKRQLVRQLTAGMLNCRLGICSIEHTTMLATCNTVCENEVVAGYQDCIEEIDCFNNGGIWNGGMCIYGSGECAVTGEDCSNVNPCPALPDGLPQACVPDPTCHDEGNLCEEGAEFCFEPPGKTSSVKACKAAQRNSTYFPYPSG